MAELKPCPFCGETPALELFSDGFYDYARIRCCRIIFDWRGDKTGEKAIAAWNRRAQPEKEPCADCTGIMYRQTASGKIIPADSKCPAAVPTCYQPDGDGCAYQIYGDNDDEPIDRCKACPLCYTDKERHKKPENEPLTLDELRQMDGEPVWVEVLEDGYKNPPYWAIVDTANGRRSRGVRLISYIDGDSGAYELYGETWLAYRRKPERSEG